MRPPLSIKALLMLAKATENEQNCKFKVSKTILAAVFNCI